MVPQNQHGTPPTPSSHLADPPPARAQILFLNKDDVFRAQLAHPHSQIRDYFPEYDGPPGAAGYEAGREFFKNQFVGLNRSMAKEVYTQ